MIQKKEKETIIRGFQGKVSNCNASGKCKETKKFTTRQ